MMDLPYSPVIEADEEPDYLGVCSTGVQGFTGTGHSVEDCLYQARWGMKEHVSVLRERGLPPPAPTSDPKITIENERRLMPFT